MKLAIFGASGGTGRQLVEQALRQGHEVKALVRDPVRLPITHARLLTVPCDVLDTHAVLSAVRGSDAVLSALGVISRAPTTVLSDAIRNIIQGMRACNLQRLICESSHGVGQSRLMRGALYDWLVVPLFVKGTFEDKERQEAYIKDSGLEWVIVHPTRLTHGPLTGQYRHGTGLGVTYTFDTISRADVADFMLKQLGDTDYLRQTVTLTY